MNCHALSTAKYTYATTTLLACTTGQVVTYEMIVRLADVFESCNFHREVLKVGVCSALISMAPGAVRLPTLHEHPQSQPHFLRPIRNDNHLSIGIHIPPGCERTSSWRSCCRRYLQGHRLPVGWKGSVVLVAHSSVQLVDHTITVLLCSHSTQFDVVENAGSAQPVSLQLRAYALGLSVAVEPSVSHITIATDVRVTICA